MYHDLHLFPKMAAQDDQIIVLDRDDAPLSLISTTVARPGPSITYSYYTFLFSDEETSCEPVHHGAMRHLRQGRERWVSPSCICWYI